MLDPQQRADLVALLAWYREMGIDAVIAEEPIDWLARGDTPPGSGLVFADEVRREPAMVREAPPARAPERSVARTGPPVGSHSARGAPAAAPRQFPTAPPDAAAMAARSLARAAGSLEALHAALKTFDGCGLKATAKNLCFYRGSAKARVMIVGEAPGREEDLEGKPFVGRAGQLLDKMLAAAGLGEADVHITNIVYWRPPGNRTPTPQEVQVCRPFLDRQMELVAPDIVLTLGGPASNALLEFQGGIMKARGRWRELTVGERTVRAMPTLHPAYLLRTPIAKRLAWRDLLAVKAALAG